MSKNASIKIKKLISYIKFQNPIFSSFFIMKEIKSTYVQPFIHKKKSSEMKGEMTSLIQERMSL